MAGPLVAIVALHFADRDERLGMLAERVWFVVPGVSRMILTLAAVIVAGRWYRARRNIDSRCRECLRDASTRSIPPLEGGVLGGMKCCESSSTSMRWTHVVPTRQQRFTMLHPPLLLLLPFGPERFATLFDGGEGGADFLDVAFSMVSTIPIVLFCIMLSRSVHAGEITIERGVDEPRLHFPLSGVGKPR